VFSVLSPRLFVVLFSLFFDPVAVVFSFFCVRSWVRVVSSGFSAVIFGVSILLLFLVRFQTGGQMGDVRFATFLVKKLQIGVRGLGVPSHCLCVFCVGFPLRFSSSCVGSALLSAGPPPQPSMISLGTW